MMRVVRTAEWQATVRAMMTRYQANVAKYARPTYAPKCAPTVYLERKPCVRAA
jgi:hypothetical protein